MTVETKHPGGRPPNLTEEFLTTIMDVVNREDIALIFTDEELVFTLNGPSTETASGRRKRRQEPFITRSLRRRSA
jgi:hypothetical protein